MSKNTKLIRGKIEPEVLAYAAAAFECEGSVTISRAVSKAGYHHTTPFLSVANIDRRLVNWLQENFGGSILTEQPKKLMKRTIYRWKLYARHCIEFLRLVLPYLKFKRDRALLLIDFWERKTNLSNQERDAYWLNLKALNRGESPAETKRESGETNLRSDSPTLVETPVSDQTGSWFGSPN